MSDQINIIGPKIYSPLPKAAERKEVPAHCDDTRESKWVPITAPPPDCREVSQAPQLFDEYTAALKSYLGNPRLKRKIEHELPLAPAEHQVMDKIKAAEENVYRYGVAMFSAAFLSANPAPNSLTLWREYAAQAEQLPINPAKTNSLFLLTDPKLSIADRKLLLAYCSDPAGEIKPELAERFAAHYRAIGENYNGWQGGSYYTAGHLFINILAEILGPYGLEKFETELFGRDAGRHLVRLDADELAKFSALDRDRLLLQYLRTNNEYIKAEPGAYKAFLHRRVRDLHVLLLARGYSLEQHERNDFARLYPGLAADEYAALRTVNFYSRHTAGRYYLFHQEVYKVTMGRFLEAYLRAPRRRQMTYALALHGLEQLAGKFGLMGSSLDQLLSAVCRRSNCRLTPPGRLATLADLTRLKNSDVSPEGLPAEVKYILNATGYWGLVSRNISRIAFTPRINIGRATDLTIIQGLAVPFLRRVDIAYLASDGRPASALEIAMRLVHEAAHVAWRGHDRLLQQSTPDERNSFAVQYRFLKKYEILFGSSFALTEQLKRLEKTITAANRVLGYELHDLYPNVTTLPSLEYCRSRGVAGPEELDLTFYPNGGL